MAQQTVHIPAEDFMHVAEVVKRLTEGGVPIRDLSISVDAGEMQLVDATGSYGSHVWAR